jgi:protein TonB
MRTAAVALVCVFVVGSAVWGQDTPLKVAEATALRAAIERVIPEYPTLARQLRLSGTVEVEALVDLEGKVAKAQIVRGNPVLGIAAVAAMKRWKFTPFVLNGRTTRALTTITFDFRL